METERSCVSCRYFNRWGIGFVTWDEDDRPEVCKKRKWAYEPGMSDDAIVTKLSTAATCELFEARQGGPNGRLQITIQGRRPKRSERDEGSDHEKTAKRNCQED